MPVPRPLAMCEDDAVTGAPFYVMEHVDGHVLSTVAAAESIGADARARVGSSLVETLARLQTTDLDTTGLAEMRRPGSYASRQLRRWRRQWKASRTRDLPVVDRVADRLEASVPEETEVTIVHGDYHLLNTIVGPEGEVRAVVDWELCTVGDPLADLGLTMAYWRELGQPAAEARHLFREPITQLDGFFERREPRVRVRARQRPRLSRLCRSGFRLHTGRSRSSPRASTGAGSTIRRAARSRSTSAPPSSGSPGSQTGPPRRRRCERGAGAAATAQRQEGADPRGRDRVLRPARLQRDEVGRRGRGGRHRLDRALSLLRVEAALPLRDHGPGPRRVPRPLRADRRRARRLDGGAARRPPRRVRPDGARGAAAPGSRRAARHPRRDRSLPREEAARAPPARACAPSSSRGARSSRAACNRA